MISVIIAGCTGIPDNVTAVDNFELDKYLGKWYEIARFDHPFERNLTNVSATYTKREDGGIDVLNKGYNRVNKEWKEADGRAYFIESPASGRLEVSFFRPFYSGYNVIALDKNKYSYAVVCGPDFDYLWILAREKELPQTKLDSLVVYCKNLGFNTGEFIFVDQSAIEDGSSN